MQRNMIHGFIHVAQNPVTDLIYFLNSYYILNHELTWGHTPYEFTYNTIQVQHVEKMQLTAL